MEENCREEELCEIRQKTSLGHPIGDLVFTEKLSKLLGRELIFKKQGQPKKEISLLLH